MKRPMVLTALLISGAVVLSAGVIALSGKAESLPREMALVAFLGPVKITDVFLEPGEYLFVHDEVKMARGEPCTYIYRCEADQPSRLVVSFHCRPIKRAPAKHFTVLMTPVSISGNVSEIREYQFAGSSEGHGVP